MARLVALYRVRFYGLAVLFALGAAKIADIQAEETAIAAVWKTGYREGLAQAKADKSLALLWFCDPREKDENDKFAAAVLNDPQVQERLAGVALVKLPLDAAIAGSSEKEPSIVLLEHAAFAEMLHKPGLAIIDMRDEKSPHFNHVVSVYPFVRQPISREGLIAMLELPSGSLTQRTLIWAVRTHSEHPQSGECDYSSYLAAEAESHSQHQASINLQGHHNWDQRFQEINGKLGNGMVSREVCAESWPNQRLVEAAEECVHSWRQSSGHWEGVSGKHASFGYDMKLGTNGIWYATGIFGDRR
ncbi:MAG: hypothetical protein K8R36_01865 [Planctomycetales bacterium]|nr:hypothetical protein [Planctomycetales bacterium]